MRQPTEEEIERIKPLVEEMRQAQAAAIASAELCKQASAWIAFQCGVAPSQEIVLGVDHGFKWMRVDGDRLVPLEGVS